jgi:hypothetical protein
VLGLRWISRAPPLAEVTAEEPRYHCNALVRVEGREDGSLEELSMPAVLGTETVSQVTPEGMLYIHTSTS